MHTLESKPHAINPHIESIGSREKKLSRKSKAVSRCRTFRGGGGVEARNPGHFP